MEVELGKNNGKLILFFYIVPENFFGMAFPGNYQVTRRNAQDAGRPFAALLVRLVRALVGLRETASGAALFLENSLP